MQLSMAAIGWLVKRVLTLAVIVLMMFGTYLLTAQVVPEIVAISQTDKQLAQVQDDKAEKERELQAARKQYDLSVEAVKDLTLAELVTKAETAVDGLKQQIQKKQNELPGLRGELCSGWKQALETAAGAVGFPRVCAIAAEKLHKAEEAVLDLNTRMQTAESKLQGLLNPTVSIDEKLKIEGHDPSAFVDLEGAREITDLEGEIGDLSAEDERLKGEQNTWRWKAVAEWRDKWKWLVGAAIVILLARPTMRTFNYFVVLPLISRVAKPVRLSTGEDAEQGRIAVGPAERSLNITLEPGEVLNARAQHLRDVQGTVRSQVFYDWRSPFISYAAGLYWLSRVTVAEETAQMTIADPEESDSYVMRIDFQDHPGLVMHPRHIVGMIGAPGLKARWHWGWHFLATGQARYILFTGTGSLLVQGISDIKDRIPAGRGSKTEQNTLMGFDSRLSVTFRRTENFPAYLGGKKPLVDEVFSGAHPYFWQKTATGSSKNPLVKGFEAVFSAIGKVLGF